MAEPETLDAAKLLLAIPKDVGGLTLAQFERYKTLLSGDKTAWTAPVLDGIKLYEAVIGNVDGLALRMLPAHVGHAIAALMFKMLLAPWNPDEQPTPQTLTIEGETYRLFGDAPHESLLEIGQFADLEEGTRDKTEMAPVPDVCATLYLKPGEVYTRDVGGYPYEARRKLFQDHLTMSEAAGIRNFFLRLGRASETSSADSSKPKAAAPAP